MGLLERLVIVSGLLLPQAGCVNISGDAAPPSYDNASPVPQHQSTSGAHRHRRGRTSPASSEPAKPKPAEELDARVKEALDRFTRLSEPEQQRHYVTIELLVRGQTPYGAEFDRVHQQILDHGILAVNRPRKERGGVAHQENSPFGVIIAMEMYKPNYGESVAGLLLAGKATPGSDRVGTGWLALKYHEMLHALALDQLSEDSIEAPLREAHQATRSDLSFKRYLEMRRGFRITKAHRRTETYKRYKAALPLDQQDEETIDRIVLAKYGLSTVLEAVAYRRANNMTPEEITAQLRAVKDVYPDVLIGGINVQQVSHLVRAIDRLYALDLDDYAVAGTLVRAGWSYDTGSKRYTALEDAVRTRMAEVGRFETETDTRVFATQERRTQDLAQVRAVVERYLLDTFQ